MEDSQVKQPIRKTFKDREFNFWLIYGCYYGGSIWIRLITGHGFRIKNINLHPLLFSERINKRGTRIGDYHIRYLQPLIIHPKFNGKNPPIEHQVMDMQAGIITPPNFWENTRKSI